MFCNFIIQSRQAELHSEKKLKMRKEKLKTSEQLKDLANIRVVQRDVVYVASLPVNIANEQVCA